MNSHVATWVRERPATRQRAINSLGARMATEHSSEHALIIAVVATLQYLNAATCGFVFDDHFAVENNRDADARRSGAGLLYHDFWGKDLRKSDSHKSWRPLTVMSFRVVHRFFAADGGGHSPFVAHICNIMLHALISVLVFYMVRAHLARSDVGVGARRSNRCLALSAALLFAVHPVHVEAVTGVVGRADLLCAILMLTALRLYRCVDDMNAESSTRGGMALKSVGYLVAFVLCTWSAIFAKEVGIMVLAIVGWSDVSHALCTVAVAPLAPKRHRHSPSARCAAFVPVLLRRVALRWSFALVCGVGYLVLRAYQALDYRYTFRANPSLTVDLFPRTVHIFLSGLLIMCERGGTLLGLPPLAVAGVERVPPPKSAGGFFRTLSEMLANGDWRFATLATSGLLRKAENPFAFLESKLSTGLSLAYLQARWAQLLLFPQQLCAEYSFNCIAPIESLLDPRNLLTLLLAVWSVVLLFISFGASRRQGARVLRCKRTLKTQRHAASAPGIAAAGVARQLVKGANERWRRQQHTLRVAIAMTVFPHIPGSNLLTPVGTLIAERLLYIPSIGFVLGGAVLWQMRETSSGGVSGEAAAGSSAHAAKAKAKAKAKATAGGEQKERSPRSGGRVKGGDEGWTLRQLRVAAVVVLVFAWCAQRTWLRTIEWNRCVLQGYRYISCESC